MEKQEPSYLLILYVMAFSMVMYGILLALLDFLGEDPTGEPVQDFSDILLPVFVAIAIVALLAQFRFIVPKIRMAATAGEAFTFMIISSVLSELIGILGLVAGILDLFVFQRDIQWEIAISFLLVGFLLQLYLIQTTHKPVLDDLRLRVM
ncbi:MAG: hypothetical protein ACXAE3_08650 [Candidatus Kariarchaeaceae archaeon]|jgi:Na+-translocating ferredoxin:NAD+ oxidoreductase RnfD subunit